MNADRPQLRLWPLLLAGSLLALGDIAIFLAAGISCGISDNVTGRARIFCTQTGSTVVLLLPLLGALVVLICIPIARWLRQLWIFALGALIAIATGAYLVSLMLD